jgi:hypothetical protein
VARVGDEAPLAREPGLEPPEHVVERLAEPVDLVAGTRKRKTPAGRVARDVLRSAPHRLDRMQRRAGEEVAGCGGEQERERPGDEELLKKSFERLFAILERSADDEDDGLALGLRRRHEQPPGIFEARHLLASEKERAVERAPLLGG